MIVLDTNIVIEYLKGNEKVIKIVDEYSEKDNLSITYISKYELLKYSSKLSKTFSEFIENIMILFPDKEAAGRSASIYINLKNKGNMINENDILILGIALRDENTFITSDNDFSKIDDKNIILIQ